MLHSSSVKSDTYELLEEGYLKWGIYDAGYQSNWQPAKWLNIEFIAF